MFQYFDVCIVSKKCALFSPFRKSIPREERGGGTQGVAGGGARFSQN